MNPEFLSVSQFAEKNGTNVWSVRKFISEGRLPAQKIGNQWVISSDAAMPDDRRIKSGKYKSWRKQKATGK